MPRRLGLCAIITAALLIACAPAITPATTPAPTARPTHTRMPSPAPVATPTATVSVVPTPVVCPAGYSLHVNDQMGFYACYPSDWLVSKREYPDSELLRVDFSAPAGSRGAGLRFIAVSSSPALEEWTDDEFLQDIDNWLRQEFYQRLLEQPHLDMVDEHRAVDAAYEARVVMGREVVDITRWVTAFRAHDKRWFIDVTGRTEYRDEVERIRGQFLAHLLIVPH